GQDEKVVAKAFKEVQMPERKLTRRQQFKAFRLDTLFTLLYESGAFNGNVLVAQNDTIIFQKSFGHADKDAGILLHDSSSFQLASVSKTITAASVLILVDKGVLSLEDPVTKYIDSFPWPKVKIKHLLSHRSGLQNYIYLCSPMCKERNNVPFCNEEMLCLFDSARAKEFFKPDEQFSYNNTNYFLLASIVERSTGITFEQFVNSRIFKPLGMKNTFLCSDTAKLHSYRNTKGYTFKWDRVQFDPYDGVFGDKGVYSSTTDLLLFANAYFNGKLFSQKILKDATSPHSPEDKTHNYGYGWRMVNFENNNPEKLIFHNGWWHGYRTAFQRRLKDNTTVIILSNRLNKSVYSTWRVYKALDGATDTTGLHLQLKKEDDGE
ncbi:MAG: beta-lactamase family protein, partial [Bacteroidia bacterium]|nr:beta-lactamase family protein [Bacteroidia bacterium]